MLQAMQVFPRPNHGATPAQLVGFGDPAQLVGAEQLVGAPFQWGLGQYGDTQSDLRAQLLGLGIPGALLGAGILTLLSAWAFHSHNPERPKWKPALILGGGSFALTTLGLGLIAATMNPQVALFTNAMMTAG